MRAAGLRRFAGARAALVSFAVLEFGAIPLLVFFGRRWWFWADDWDFLAGRTGGNVKDLFRAHYQHWTTLPILAYRLLWLLVGLRSYVPYQLMVIVAHLVAAALLRVVMRRAGVRPWLATIICGGFVFFGAGAENILIAFQITFVGSLVFGLVQLLAADHDGPISRRDWLGLLAGFAGLMCSGVAVAMTVIVGIAVFARRGWKVAAFHTAPLGAAYLIWFWASPSGQGGGAYRSQSPLQALKFVTIGIEAAFARMGHLRGIGIALAVLLIVGSFLVLRVERVSGGIVRALRTRLAVAAALLVGSVVFLVVTGIVRSGAPGPLANAIGVGPGRARQSRYVYIVAAMALPAIAIAADAVVTRWRAMMIPVVLVLVAGVPGNIHRLAGYTKMNVRDRDRFRTLVLEAPRLPLARSLPPDLSPAPPASFSGLTMGWLVGALPSGRIPKPGPLTPAQIATQTIHLVLHPLRLGFVQPHDCRTLRAPVTVELDRTHHVRIKSGLVAISYLAPDGGVSTPELYEPQQLASLVDGLPLRVTPADASPVTLCT